MHATLGYELDLYLDSIWRMWVDFAGGVPFWDPYGAVSTVFLGLTVVGLLVRKVMD